uniref:Uncharacterized protein n=1 Tax=Prolemur simus TaxID=1328070 RepID=A0A8C8Z197_PROSS
IPCPRDVGVIPPRDLKFTSYRRQMTYILKRLRTSSSAAASLHEPRDLAASMGLEVSPSQAQGTGQDVEGLFPAVVTWLPHVAEATHLSDLLFVPMGALGLRLSAWARLPPGVVPSCLPPAVSLKTCQQVKPIWGSHCLHSSPQSSVPWWLWAGVHGTWWHQGDRRSAGALEEVCLGAAWGRGRRLQVSGPV